MTFLPTHKGMDSQSLKELSLDAKVEEKLEERSSTAMFLPRHKRVYSLRERIQEKSEKIYEHIREKYQHFGKRLMRKIKQILDESETNYQRQDDAIPGSSIRNYVRSQYKIDV